MLPDALCDSDLYLVDSTDVFAPEDFSVRRKNGELPGGYLSARYGFDVAPNSFEQSDDCLIAFENC